MPETMHDFAPILFLLCGLPFAGKSTMSRAMRERFGIAHVEVDAFVGSSDGDRVSPGANVWLPAYREAIAEVKMHLRDGRSVVFDAVGHHRRHRRRMARLAASLGARMAVIQFDVGEAEARERLLANRLEPVRPNVPSESFAWIVREMELPEPDERALIYRPSEPLGSWMERVISPLLANSGTEERG